MFAQALRNGWDFFRANPAGEAVLAALFLLASLTGILLGPAALLYLWHLTPKDADPLAQNPVIGNLLLFQRLQGTRRMAAAFWLGLVVWALTVLPGFHHTLVLGIPAGLLLAQFAWVAILFADRFDLPLGVACRAALRLLLDAPATALACVALGLLAWVGVFAFGIGVLITLPVALRALAVRFAANERELAAAVQGAYR